MILIISTAVTIFGVCLASWGSKNYDEGVCIIGGVLIILSFVFGFGLLGCTLPIHLDTVVKLPVIEKHKFSNGMAVFISTDHTLTTEEGEPYAKFDKVNQLKKEVWHNSYGYVIETKYSVVIDGPIVE